jgi:Lon protease-like protein
MELPLFPLHTVLCPGIALPLHIFEERYRALVRDCVESSSPFGVVLIRDGREVGGGSISFSAIGTLAEIREAGRYADGRYDLLVVGTKRFAIADVATDRKPYMVAQATVIDDELGDGDAARRLANTATRRFVHYLELLQPREGETADEIDVRVEVETENVMPGEDDPDAAERWGWTSGCRGRSPPPPRPGWPARRSNGGSSSRTTRRRCPTC